MVLQNIGEIANSRRSNLSKISNLWTRLYFPVVCSGPYTLCPWRQDKLYIYICSVEHVVTVSIQSFWNRPY